jgi:hypothetical protein
MLFIVVKQQLIVVFGRNYYNLSRTVAGAGRKALLRKPVFHFKPVIYFYRRQNLISDKGVSNLYLFLISPVETSKQTTSNLVLTAIYQLFSLS